MKTLAAIALLAAAAAAQLPNIPQCALQCFLGTLTSDGCSSLTDFACHCSKTDLIPKVQPCIQNGCSAEDQAAVVKAAQEACAAAGVPIAMPAAPAAATPAPAAVETPAPVLAHTDAYGATVMTTTTRTSVSEVVVTATISPGMTTPPYSAGNATVNNTSMKPTTTKVASFTGAAERRGVAGGLIGLAAVVAAVAM